MRQRERGRSSCPDLIGTPAVKRARSRNLPQKSNAGVEQAESKAARADLKIIFGHNAMRDFASAAALFLLLTVFGLLSFSVAFGLLRLLTREDSAR
jgi:hypothetical protein